MSPQNKKLHFLDFINQDFKTAKVVIIPVPYDGTVTYIKGAAKGPEAILLASESLEEFDEETGKELKDWQIFTMPIPDNMPKHPFAVIKYTEKEVLSAIKNKKIPFVIGGEHSISVGGVLAFKEAGFDFEVLYLDAHLDLRDKYNSSKYNHACAARRIIDMGIPVTFVGIRSIAKEEAEFVKKKKISVFRASGSQVAQILRNLKKKNVYISLDFDVFDPSIMPSVGNPQPGGVFWYEMLNLLKQLTKKKKIIGADFVEFSPISGFATPDVLAAKLIYKMIQYLVKDDV